jgi:hypothetical protein
MAIDIVGRAAVATREGCRRSDEADAAPIHSEKHQAELNIEITMRNEVYFLFSSFPRSTGFRLALCIITQDHVTDWTIETVSNSKSFFRQSTWNNYKLL